MYTQSFNNNHCSRASSQSSMGAVTIADELVEGFYPTKESYRETLLRSRESLPISKKTNNPTGNSGIKVLLALASTCRHASVEIPQRLSLMIMKVLEHVSKKKPIPEMDPDKIVGDGTALLFKDGQTNMKEDDIVDLQIEQLPDFIEQANLSIHDSIFRTGSASKDGSYKMSSQKEFIIKSVMKFWSKVDQNKHRSTSRDTSSPKYSSTIAELWKSPLIKRAFRDDERPTVVSDQAMNTLFAMYYSFGGVNVKGTRYPLKVDVVGDEMKHINAVRSKRKSSESSSGIHVSTYYLIPKDSGIPLLDGLYEEYQDKKYDKTRANIDEEIKSIDFPGILQGGTYISSVNFNNILMRYLPSLTKDDSDHTEHVIINDRDFIMSTKITFLLHYTKDVKSRVKALNNAKTAAKTPAITAERTSAFNEFEKSIEFTAAKSEHTAKSDHTTKSEHVIKKDKDFSMLESSERKNQHKRELSQHAPTQRQGSQHRAPNFNNFSNFATDREGASLSPDPDTP